MQGKAGAGRKSKAEGAKARRSSNQSSRTKSRQQHIALPSKGLDKQLISPTSLTKFSKA